MPLTSLLPFLFRSSEVPPAATGPSPLPAAPVPKPCLNCRAALAGPYCASCGQSASTRPLSFRTVFADALDHILGYESPLLRTFLELNYIPGLVARRYIEGQRKRYTNPLKYCLLAAAVELLVIHLTGTELQIINSDQSTGITGIVIQLDPFPEVDRAVSDITAFAAPYLGFATILVLPLMAVSLRLLFPRSKPNVAEYLTLCLFFQAQAYLWQCPLFALTAAGVPHLSALPPLLPVLGIILTVVQFRPSPGNRFLIGLRAIFAYFIYIIALVVVLILAALVLAALRTANPR